MRYDCIESKSLNIRNHSSSYQLSHLRVKVAFMTPTNILKTIPLFESLSDENIQKLTGLLRRMTIRSGEILFREGDEGTALYIIHQGRIKISMSKLLDKLTLAILGQGEFLGEMALLDGQPRSADAVAMEETQLYALNRKDFLSFLMNNDNAVRNILTALSMRLRNTDNLLAEMCFLSLSARLAKKLVELAATSEQEQSEYSLNISQQELANILGVSRESINKELSILRSRKILSTSRKSIRINDLDLLKRRMR
jgi:CRP/FNR family transcriptional regulator, cyclic AMP receptor protein